MFDFKKIKKIHFIGIGGIGVSAIVRMMLNEKKKISGSDQSISFITNELKKLGVKIHIGHRAENLKPDTDLVIYTIAIDSENPELKKAQSLKIPIFTYPQFLGEISKNKYTIAICGCHGKTTTTGMIAKILIDAHLQPTALIGGFLKNYQSNFIFGKGKYLVCEACEYKKSFLNIWPKIIVLTNIDNDHLDFYKNLKNIQKAFLEFANKLNKNDFLICNKNDKNLRSIIQKVNCEIIDYSKISLPLNFKLKIFGKHNIENAKAALALSNILKIDKKLTLKSIQNFKGAWRRLEYKGKTKNGAMIYDDYAHHPAEIKASLKALREKFPNKKIWVVFQPHLFSRLKILLNDFAKSFNDAYTIIITDIYAAREKKDNTIHSRDLAKEVKKNNKNVFYISSFKEIAKFLKKAIKKGEIIITMGAGDIYKIHKNLI